MEQRISVGVSGATGSILAFKTIQALVEAGYLVDLVITKAALYTAVCELGKEFATSKRFISNLPGPIQEKVQLHSIHDVGSTIASGSHPSKGMVIVPCSVATVAAIAHGLGDNCLRRAADVTIKEKRPLVIVVRETPLSTIHLENMLKLTQAGATIMPPVPAWYNLPKSMDEMEDILVGKILDCLGIESKMLPKWQPSHQIIQTSDVSCAAH
ncbi:MAG: Flavin prenyltransferase UbiX [Chlamydiales bacterium]|nr:Flavin prenyltransferase UbiX [Chlamydiales bacterium]MCH9634870.1 Flavin prenyltransferase UbiX [Chlamydiales bacterium]